MNERYNKAVTEDNKVKYHDHQAYQNQELDLGYLENTSNHELAEIYSYLYSYLSDVNDDTLVKNLEKIYLESKIRYDRLATGKSEYELELIFQGLDAILQQINHSSFVCIEKFLEGKNSFTNEVLLFLVKHLDHMKAVGVDCSEELGLIINAISKNLLSRTSDTHILMLNSFKEKIESPLTKTQLKRYNGLDDFALIYLRRQYAYFIKNMNFLMQEKATGGGFVRSIMASKISNYYVPSVIINSTARSRLIEGQRKKIFDVLRQINLPLIYNPNVKTHLMRIVKKKHIIKSSAYVNKTLSVMIKRASPGQIRSFLQYICSIETQMPEIADFVLAKIKKLLRRKTSIKSMVYLYATGNSKIFKDFKAIKV